MPLGFGYFCDRKTKRFIKINEHATDALKKKEVFGTQDIQHLNPVTNRDEIVLHVLKNGFIRIREWKGKIGWQFWGNQKESKELLKRYIKKFDIGEYATITFTDFEAVEEIQDIAKNFT